MTLGDELYVVDEIGPGWISVSALQCGLRELFASKPPHRAVALALEQIASVFDADYAVIHACFGVQPLSEEWSSEGFALSEALREQINNSMGSVTDDEARCTRFRMDEHELAVTVATMFDEGADASGKVALVFKDRGRAQAYEVLAQFESIVGFVGLLLSSRPSSSTGAVLESLTQDEVGQPLRLLLRLVSQLSARHDFDQVAIGTVSGRSVQVALVNHDIEPRASNPGVRRIQQAMLECLDVGEPIQAGPEEGTRYRLHEVWQRSREGGPVASIPLLLDSEIVAVVSVACPAGQSLSESVLRDIQASFAPYVPLIPFSRQVTRSLFRHARDTFAAQWERTRGKKKRTLIVAALGAMMMLWLFAGTLTYRLTVPCVVRAMDRRVASCPRDGVLAELYARPGDLVQKGQLLAELDSHDDELTKAELDAEILALDAQIDAALGEFDSGKLRVLEAERAGLVAKVAVVVKRIEHAKIRAQIDGVVLAGELREHLGARIAMGDNLFELARYDGAIIEMRVPEHLVLAARQSRSQRFIAKATPGKEYELRGFRVAPATTVHEGKNVFIGEAELAETVQGLPPGIEGFAVVEVGPRRAFWVLTHRILGWLRLNFWV